MIFGIPITGPELIAMGLILIAATTFQVLVGLRYIKLGRLHYKIHKWTGIGILSFAILHAIAGSTFAMGWSIF